MTDSPMRLFGTYPTKEQLEAASRRLRLPPHTLHRVHIQRMSGSGFPYLIRGAAAVNEDGEFIQVWVVFGDGRLHRNTFGTIVAYSGEGLWFPVITVEALERVARTMPPYTAARATHYDACLAAAAKARLEMSRA